MSTEQKKIKLLLPKGSLNTPPRGDTYGLLRDAGYDVSGYEPGKENERQLSIRNDSDIEVMLSRPQSAPNELILGMADIAIIGADWVAEEDRGSKLELLSDLDYGKTRIVFAVPQNETATSLDAFLRKTLDAKGNLLCFSEMVNSAAKAIAETSVYRERFIGKSPMIRVRGIISGNNDKIQVIMSDGVTEGYIKKGADIILDNTQSGSTIKEYGLRELEQIAASSAGLYGSKVRLQDTWISSKSQEIVAQLAGVIEARKKDYVVFNIPNAKLGPVIEYVTEQQLFTDEPTVTGGKEFTTVSILVPKKNWPQVSGELRNYGATGIMRYEPRQVITGGANNVK